MSQHIDMDAVIAELRKGWTKRTYFDVQGRACVIGACQRVAKDSSAAFTRDVNEALIRPARELFPGREIGEETYAIANFNDHPDTTLDDVILVCEKARAAQGEAS